jgi:hypothetical protein
LPLSELRFDGQHDIVQFWEVTVMDGESAGQLSHPLEGIQVRAVGWQEVQDKAAGLGLMAPVAVHPCVVVAGVIDDHHYFSSGAGAAGTQLLEKLPVGGGIELFRFPANAGSGPGAPPAGG